MVKALRTLFGSRTVVRMPEGGDHLDPRNNSDRKNGEHEGEDDDDKDDVHSGLLSPWKIAPISVELHRGAR
jgi:hypothetical protein